MNKITVVSEPNTYEKACETTEWRNAMAKELEALYNNKTWSIVELPQGKKPIGCKWIYKLKFNPDGTVARHKARLVAKGYSQVEGLDYNETFSPVAKLTTVRIMLSLAAIKNLKIHQFDVNNAFLHGDLEEEVYMEIPPGLHIKGENMVCKLHKSIYGLKQASRAWFQKLNKVITHAGFVQSQADYSLFTHSNGDLFTAILIYVDDILVTGTNVDTIQQMEQVLDSQFQIKRLGAPKYFLGLEITRSSAGIFINQRKYVLDILAKTGLIVAKPAITPIEQRHELHKIDQDKLKDGSQYRRLVGKLIYLTITRPDITYAVNLLSQYMHEPCEKHWRAAMRVVRFLKGSPGSGIFFFC